MTVRCNFFFLSLFLIFLPRKTMKRPRQGADSMQIAGL